MIDDAESMRPYWQTVKNLVGTLAYIVKDCDPDGIELYYTISSDKLIKSTKSSVLIDSLNSTTPSGISDIGIRLSSILNQYKAKLHRTYGAGTSRTSFSRKDIRPLNLYVLTDGVWQPECDAEAPIKELVKKLLELGMDKKKVGIQFISFGDDHLGLRRLDHLDSKLEVGGKKIGL